MKLCKKDQEDNQVPDPHTSRIKTRKKNSTWRNFNLGIILISGALSTNIYGQTKSVLTPNRFKPSVVSVSKSTGGTVAYIKKERSYTDQKYTITDKNNNRIGEIVQVTPNTYEIKQNNVRKNIVEIKGNNIIIKDLDNRRIEEYQFKQNNFDGKLRIDLKK